MFNRLSLRAWQLCLSLFVAGTAVYFMLPRGSLGQAAVFIAAEIIAVGVVFAAVPRVPSRDRPVWRLLGAGQALSLVANVLWYLVPVIRGTQPPFPSMADVLFLGSYAVSGTALGWLVRQRVRERGWGPALDAGIVTTAVAGLSYIFLIQFLFDTPGTSALQGLTAVAYPVADIVLLGLVTTLIMAGGLRIPTVGLLVGFAASQFFGDSAFTNATASGTFRFGGACFAGWLLGYGLLAVAALHPSRERLTEPLRRVDTVRNGRLRLGLVGAASLIMPAALVLTQIIRRENETLDVVVLCGLAALMFGLIVLRMGVLLGELARSEGAVRYQALHDALTGLPNRALVLDRVQQSLARSVRRIQPISLLMIDLDGFKQINDALGHEVGDKVLLHVADTLRDSVRPADTAARWGGDEFTVVLDNADQVAATLVAERILDALGRPAVYSGTELVTQVSIGIVTCVDGTTSPADLFRNADVAMYGAKTRGKACYMHFEPYMHADVVRAIEMQVGLERAIQRGELVVHYQPIVRLSTEALIGVEALVRWQHPQRGMIQPNDFIPLAEQTGIIVPLGQFVLRTACADLSRWRTKFPATAELKLSVNLSGRQLMNPALTSQVLETLAAAGLEPTCLIVEITERVLVDDASGALATVAALRAAGVTVAIDDFGTGYSSLGYLRNLPADVVKIDRAFVGNMSTGTDHAFVQSIVAMIKTLGLESVAEGVETRDQADAMLAMGCDEAQGYYFARPIDAAGMDEFLEGGAVWNADVWPPDARPRLGPPVLSTV